MRGQNKRNVVLIADDDLFIRKVIRSALEGMAEIVEVADGAEVQDAYTKCMPDILFLDIHLPNISGLELLKQISKKDLGSYVIILSADSTEGNVQQAKFRGSRGFLTKPFR